VRADEAGCIANVLAWGCPGSGSGKVPRKLGRETSGLSLSAGSCSDVQVEGRRAI